jgi:hypothetical protein
MRRLLSILLLVLLPLQFSWAAVAPYCGHEAAPEVQHVGHHAHEHHADVPAVPVAQAEVGEQAAAEATPWMVDLDCAQCHANGAVASGTDDGLRADHRSVHPSPQVALMVSGHPQSRPDRPQWLGLA